MRSTKDAIVVITSPEDVTANLVIASLNERGACVARVDPADVGSGLTFGARLGGERASWSGRLRTTSRDIALEEVRAVYYRRPSPWRFETLEAQARDFAITEARHGLHGLITNLPNCRYVNNPGNISRSDYKPAQLQIAAQLGFAIPETLITNDLEAAKEFAIEHDPIVYKSFRGIPHKIEGKVATIWTQRVDSGDLDESIAVTAHMFQAEIPKHSDARVTVVGSHVFASQITSPEGMLDWRSGDWEALAHTPIRVPSSVVARLHAYLYSFGLAFGCFDFALEETEGGVEPYRWVFIECNPNGQWGWLPDAEAIADAFAHTLLEGYTV
ncbi:ATP-grasp ribosomal peptide maturase [Nonomuraea sp. NPDC003804]|uniref:ATP-grasp ribosomal peptide maturase n=1 Tax=Nonomuraea sp. NPDC003804 TaxID=3154547 RepID=UPI0033B01F76